MADLQRLFPLLKDHGDFDESQLAQLAHFLRAGTVAEFLSYNEAMRAMVAGVLDLPAVREKLGEDYDALLQLVGLPRSPLGPGVETRWGLPQAGSAVPLAEARVLGPGDFRNRPWVNGLGITTELFIFPPDAVFPADFIYRASQAPVDASGPFSPLPGVDRTLVVLRGTGIDLLHDGKIEKRLRPFEPYRFSGDLNTESFLLDGQPIVDFSLMTSRPRASHEVQVWELGEEKRSVTIEPGVHYLFYGATPDGAPGSFEVHLPSTNQTFLVTVGHLFFLPPLPSGSGKIIFTRKEGAPIVLAASVKVAGPLASATMETRFVRETEEKIWEFKKAIDAARIEAHRRLALVQKEGGMVTLEVYEAVMRSLIDLVNRAKEEIDRRGALISETGAPESADVRRLIHDFRGHTMTILPLDKLTREVIEGGEEINFSWLSPPQDLGSLLDAARHFGIPLKREGGVEVKVEVSPELRGFKFKETSHLDDLLRIVTNLATNGVKYINPELPAEERFVRVRAEIMGVWLMIIFEDNGRGMTREFVEKGYGRMGVRAPEVVGTSIPGTGTGASSVKKIAESLGGTVRLH